MLVTDPGSGYVGATRLVVDVRLPDILHSLVNRIPALILTSKH